jgi:hypothetical protein
MTSEELDKKFGLRINEIENNLLKAARDLRPDGDMDNLGSVLHAGSQTWIGLDPQTLNTPYEELIRLCEVLKPKSGTHMVDLGAGYGRLGLILSEMCPGVHFTGYELVKERVDEGNRVFIEREMKNSKLITQDLTDPAFKIPEVDYYFIYDYGKTAHIRQTMKQLEILADKIKFKVIARGKGSRSIIEHEHPWLSQVFDVHVEENFSIYSMSF